MSGHLKFEITLKDNEIGKEIAEALKGYSVDLELGDNKWDCTIEFMVEDVDMLTPMKKLTPFLDKIDTFHFEQIMLNV